MTTHILPAVLTRYAREANSHPEGRHGNLPFFALTNRDTWEVPGVELSILNTYQSTGYPALHRVHFCGSDAVLRTVEGAPVAQQPYAYLTPQATVISAYRDPNPPRVVEVEVGDLIVLINRDTVLRVTPASRVDDCGLEIVTTPPATMDLAEQVAEYNAYCARMRRGA